jgi:hypothetical protein
MPKSKPNSRKTDVPRLRHKKPTSTKFFQAGPLVICRMARKLGIRHAMELAMLAFYRRLIFDPSPLTKNELTNYLMLTESTEYRRWFVEDVHPARELTLGVYAALNLVGDHAGGDILKSSISIRKGAENWMRLAESKRDNKTITRDLQSAIYTLLKSSKNLR